MKIFRQNSKPTLAVISNESPAHCILQKPDMLSHIFLKSKKSWDISWHCLLICLLITLILIQWQWLSKNCKRDIILLWPSSAWSDVVPGICGLCQTFFHLTQVVTKFVIIWIARNHKSITIPKKNQSQPTFVPSAWGPGPPLSVARGLKCEHILKKPNWKVSSKVEI